LRMVKGLSAAAGRQLVAGKPFSSVDEIRVNGKDLQALAAAGALRSLAGHRRLARWAAAGAGRRAPLAPQAPEALPALLPPHEAEEIVADYASLGLTLGRHPLALLRGSLEKKRLVTAKELQLLAHGSPARAGGLVTCRQQPDTASGVIFVTLEDETGWVNVVVWNDLFRRQRAELLDARLLGVEGVVERDGEVVHLMARRLHDYSVLLGSLEARSRDFH